MSERLFIETMPEKIFNEFEEILILIEERIFENIFGKELDQRNPNTVRQLKMIEWLQYDSRSYSKILRKEVAAQIKKFKKTFQEEVLEEGSKETESKEIFQEKDIEKGLSRVSWEVVFEKIREEENIQKIVRDTMDALKTSGVAANIFSPMWKVENPKEDRE